MNTAHRALLLVSLVCATLTIGVEVGGGLIPRPDVDPEVVRQTLLKELPDADRGDVDDLVAANQRGGTPPGLAIPYLALLDGVLWFNIALLALGLLLEDQLFGKLQGLLTLVVMVVLLIACFVLIMVALAKLLLMVGMLLAVPFGTLAYMAIWAFFDSGTSGVLLSAIFLLKIAAIVTALLSQPQFLRMKGFLVLALTSVVASIVIAFLHGEIPAPIVSITDAIGAIVVGILALVWALIHAIGALPSVLKALKI